MKSRNLYIFLLILLFCVTASGQRSAEPPTRDCGPRSPESPVRPAFEFPCSDSRFFSDTGFTAKQHFPATADLNVDRFIGDPALLLENKFLEPVAKLKMAMKGECLGQLTMVKFNNALLRHATCPGKEWKVYEFDVPASLIDFPRKGGGENKNEIKVDPIAGSVTVDWMTLEIKVARPVLLIHGLSGGSGSWARWTGKDGFLQKTGLPSYQIDLGLADTIEANAAEIIPKIEELKKTWKVDKITLIGHSKGGLDARLAAENNRSVSQVIMIGTPNGGTPLADLANEIINEIIKDIPFAEIAKWWAPGVEQLSVKNVTEFNKAHKANPQVNYVSIAGDYTPNCKSDENKPNAPGEINLILSKLIGKGHLWVPVDSVYALPYANNLPPLTSKSNLACQYVVSFVEEDASCDAVHINLLRSESLFNQLKDIIGKPVSE